MFGLGKPDAKSKRGRKKTLLLSPYYFYIILLLTIRHFGGGVVYNFKFIKTLTYNYTGNQTFIVKFRLFIYILTYCIFGIIFIVSIFLWLV